MTSFATYVSSNDLSANHLAAVFYTGSQPNERRRISLEQIVVSGRNAATWSELKQWAVNRVLVQFYLAASNRAQDDRYEKKYDLFNLLENTKHWPDFKASGVPIVYQPMPVPAAAWARTPGMWSAGLTSGAGTLTTAWDMVITYVDSSVYVSPRKTGNGESDLSDPKSVTLTSGNVVSVDITNLDPPDGSVGNDVLARGFVVTRAASHWNVYAAPRGTGLYVLQNPALIPIGTKTFAFPGDPLTSGAMAGIGQWAEQFMVIPTLVNRG